MNLNSTTTTQDRSGRRLSPLGVGVHSEVGQLREVIVHRPGLELDRLTPGNAADLLFDDVMWADRAREEHDAFTTALEHHGARVHHFSDLLAQSLAIPEGRAFALDRTCTAERFGPTLASELRRLFDDTDPEGLATYLIGGVLKSDLSPLSVSSLTWSQLDVDDFLLRPVPNTLFQRDNTAWIGRGATVNPMAKPARARESIHTRTVYRHHPMFASLQQHDAFTLYYGDDDRAHSPATLEGGDIHVLDDGVLMVGMGERTTPMGVEMLARALFAQGYARTVLAIELPVARSAMHLDTVLTMIDIDTFVAYPFFDLHTTRMWRLTAPPGADSQAPLDVQERQGVREALTECLGRDVRVLQPDEDERAAQREQWNDADNFLAVAPGVVFGYERNTYTNDFLQRHGIKVVPVVGNELGRGRGGARCMTCPLHRETI